MFWSTVPELADVPKPQRGRLWRQALRDPFRPVDLLLVTMVLVFVAADVAASHWLYAHLGRGWLGSILALPVAFGCYAAVRGVFNVRYRPVLRSIRERGG